jgi:hypothetical protein
MPQPPAIIDSLKQDSAQQSLNQKHYTHIFTGHLLQPKNTGAVPYVNPTPVWPAFVMLVPVTLLVYLRVKYAKRISAVLKGFFSLQAARQLEREDYRLTRGISVILSFVYLASISFFLYQFNRYYPVFKMDWDPVVQFHLIFAGLLLIYILKFTVNILLGIILDSSNEVYEYNFNVFLSNQGIGLFMLPVAICMEYLNVSFMPLLAAGFFIIGVFYSIRLGKGIIIGLSSRTFSPFHIFLYLCGLEILPLIVLVTFLVRLNTRLNG